MTTTAATTRGRVRAPADGLARRAGAAAHTAKNSFKRTIAAGSVDAGLDEAGMGAGQNRGLVAVMITLVTAGIVAFVGIDAMSQTREQTALSEGDAFYNASQDVTAGIDSAFGMLGIVFLVLILSVVILYLRGVGQ